ncbi:MAG: lipopolysaccharide kinase InaA family protein [Planctomycetota bacterium]|nr:lipopolysaccharide kinase InaA family protein [Planctomycetota bacterium]
MVESVSTPRTLQTSNLWLYLSAAVEPLFVTCDSGEQFLEVMRAAKTRGGRNVGCGRAVVPAVDFQGVAGVWRTNRHGGLLGGMFGARYAGTKRIRDEIDVASRLMAIRINTPPILVAAAVREGIYWTQHIVTTEIKNSQTVFDARENEQAMFEAGKVMAKLFKAGYYATDLHPRNMLWVEDTKQIWVIDLAGAKMLNSELSQQQCLQRLKRFERFFVKHAGDKPSCLSHLRRGLGIS